MRRILTAALIAPLALVAGCERPRSTRTAATAQAEAPAAAKARQTRAAEAKRVRAAIEGALQADAKTGSIVDFDRRVRAMQAIDLQDCPDDFKAAYGAHIAAWQRAAMRQAAAAADGDAGPLRTRQSALRAVTASLRTRTQSQQIRDTFAAVERIAGAYGARVPDER